MERRRLKRVIPFGAALRVAALNALLSPWASPLWRPFRAAAAGQVGDHKGRAYTLSHLASRKSRGKVFGGGGSVGAAVVCGRSPAGEGRGP